jgi:hypothetical protein
MGWWQIDLTDEEVEAFEKSDEVLMNALPTRDSSKRLYTGDQPADIIDEALDKIDKVYKNTWGRKAKRQEIVAVVDFCMAGRK